MAVAFFPESLFSDEFTQRLTFQSTSLKELMGRVARVPSVGAVVARREANGTLALKVALRRSLSYFKSVDRAKNRYAFKLGFESFSNVLQFDRTALFAKVSPLGQGCHDPHLLKLGASQQFPLAFPTDCLQLFAWTSFHESASRTRVGIKVGLPLSHFSASLFGETRLPFQEEGRPKPIGLTGLKAKFKFEVTQLLKQRFEPLVGSQLKLVFPVLGLSQDEQWHLKWSQLTRLPTGWLFGKSVLDVETAVNLSNKHVHCLHQARGVDDLPLAAGEATDSFGVQTALNLKLRTDPQLESRESRFKPFWFLSLFLKGGRPARVAAGPGVEVASSDRVAVECLLDCLELRFRVRAATLD